MNKKLNFVDNFLKILKNSQKMRTNGIHEPSLNKSDKKMVNECINKNEVSAAGNYVKLFEDKLTKYTGSKYVISTATGTSALHLSLLAVGVKQNHEVIVPAFNFISAANAILYCNATPHFVDIEKKRLSIDIDLLDEYLKKITTKKKNHYVNKKSRKSTK